MSRVRSCKFTPSAVAVGVLVLATLAAPEARGASAKPDLALGRMTAPASSAPGGTFTLAVKILNEGGRAARSSRARVYLAPRARMSRGRVRLGSGARVVACVDVGRKVRERREGNNCRLARGWQLVKATMPCVTDCGPQPPCRVSCDPSPCAMPGFAPVTWPSAGWLPYAAS